MDDTDLAEFALATARAAGAAILPHFRAQIDVDHKEGGRDYDPVTAADRGAEQVIRDAIARAFPAHGIEGEEFGATAGTQPYTWVVDPIDGTRSFILGQLHWATLIALNDGARPRIGVVYQPFVDESFVAWNDIAQWRRGREERRLATRRCSQIEHALVATTDPRHFVTLAQRVAWEAATGGARMVRFGGDCYCYTQLAMGLVDVVVETGLKPWDVQALIPLIENAGGVISTWSGASCQRGGDVLACGDPRLHAAILRRIAG